MQAWISSTVGKVVIVQLIGPIIIKLLMTDSTAETDSATTTATATDEIDDEVAEAIFKGGEILGAKWNEYLNTHPTESELYEPTQSQ